MIELSSRAAETAIGRIPTSFPGWRPCLGLASVEPSRQVLATVYKDYQKKERRAGISFNLAAPGHACWLARAGVNGTRRQRVSRSQNKEAIGKVERAMGIEPTWPVWKTGTLPLSYARNREQ